MASGNRKPFLTATVLDQDLLNSSHDNLLNQLEMVCDIVLTNRTLRLSDRAKYVGGVYYEPRIVFPLIGRTVGEYLQPELQFSDLQLEISNVDGKFNDVLPGGALYDSWVGASVTVSLGLRDVGSTYRTIFEGFISGEAGFSRTVDSIKIKARNKFDIANVTFPPAVFSTSIYPNLEDDKIGLLIPVIYGDFTVALDDRIGASVPAFVVNGADATVNGDTSNASNVQLVIADNLLESFDTSNVYFRRSDLVVQVDSGDIANVAAGNNTFEIIQDNNTVIDSGTGDKLKYERGDEFFVRVKGKDLTTYSDNIVEIARDILKTYSTFVDADFDTSWNTFRDKASPAASAISTFNARVWLQEPQQVVQFTLSLLEQVRLEYFIDVNQKLKISSTHLEEFVASPSYTIRNWDVVKDTFIPTVSERNNFNRVQGEFNFLPSEGKQFSSTDYFKNQAAIDQANSTVSKKIVYPNLYEEATVDLQLQEVLKITSSYLEIVAVDVTWRSLLLDIGDFVKINVQIQGTIFENVPCLIREIGYEAIGLRIKLKLWSFQMLPFPGYVPGNAGTVGGSTATILRE